MRAFVFGMVLVALIAGTAAYVDDKATVPKVVAYKTYQGGWRGGGHILVAADGTHCSVRVGRAFVTKVGDTYTCRWR